MLPCEERLDLRGVEYPVVLSILSSAQAYAEVEAIGTDVLKNEAAHPAATSCFQLDTYARLFMAEVELASIRHTSQSPAVVCKESVGRSPRTEGLR